MKVEEELEDIDETLMDDDDQLIENIDKVHQDEDFSEFNAIPPNCKLNRKDY